MTDPHARYMNIEEAIKSNAAPALRSLSREKTGILKRLKEINEEIVFILTTLESSTGQNYSTLLTEDAKEKE